MEQGQCSLSASHQHYNTRTDQAGEEVNIAPPFGTVYPLEDLSSLISSQLPNLGNPYSSMATLQLEHFADCTPPSYMLNTTAYIDPTIFSPSYHATQIGEVPHQQLATSPSHASKPQEQMNWHHTTRDDLPAGELTQMIKEGHVFEDLSEINSTHDSYTYVNRYILADTGTSTYGSNVAYDTFGAPAAFDQDSQMTSIIHDEADSYGMNYNAESRQLPSHVTCGSSVEPSLLISCDKFLYSNPGHQLVNSQEVLPSRSFSFNVATGLPGTGEQALPFCSLETAEHTNFSHKSYTQDPVRLSYPPQMNPYTSMPSDVNGYHKMAAQSDQLEFHQGTRPPDHHAIERSFPIHPSSPVDAQFASSHKDTHNEIAVSAFSTHQLAIKDASHKASQASTYLPEQRHGHKKNRVTKPSNNTGADLSKMYQYINPVIDRERRAIQKKTRKVNEKLDRACFICKMGHRKVLVIVL
jgi:hypothetical protein